MYRSNNQLDSYGSFGDHAWYAGGGYVYEFRGRYKDMSSNLSELYRLQWIDQQTRAIIIQLNLYNPNVQLFTSVMILTERIPTGALSSLIRIEPMQFYGR
jgi:hypothetical protein